LAAWHRIFLINYIKHQLRISLKILKICLNGYTYLQVQHFKVKLKVKQFSIFINLRCRLKGVVLASSPGWLGNKCVAAIG